MRSQFTHTLRIVRNCAPESVQSNLLMRGLRSDPDRSRDIILHIQKWQMASQVYLPWALKLRHGDQAFHRLSFCYVTMGLTIAGLSVFALWSHLPYLDFQTACGLGFRWHPPSHVFHPASRRSWTATWRTSTVGGLDTITEILQCTLSVVTIILIICFTRHLQKWRGGGGKPNIPSGMRGSGG